MAILCSPWRCTDPHKWDCTSKFTQLLSNGDCVDCTSKFKYDAPQPVAPSDGAAVKSALRYTFQRAWRLRWCEIQVLAERADSKSHAARKKLTIFDTVLFSELKEPKDQIAEGEAIKTHFRDYVKVKLKRTMAHAALQRILAYAGFRSKCHDEQCTLAEYCAHFVRDVVTHSQLAAEARVKPRVARVEAVNDSESDDEDKKLPTPDLTIVDVGGGGPDDT